MVPKFLQHNWLIYKILDRELERAASHYAVGKLLDVGCGVKPYRKMFAPYVIEHIGIDHLSTTHPISEIDIFGSIYNLPCHQETFDTVLCSEVLEHVEEPGKAITELYRVLKKNGVCILTAPFYWHIHEAPRDFFRFSKFGLQYLFESNNFTIIELKAISGLWVTIMQEIVYYLIKFKKYFFLKLLVVTLSWLLQRIGYLLDKLDKDEDFATEYIVIAKKK